MPSFFNGAQLFKFGSLSSLTVPTCHMQIVIAWHLAVEGLKSINKVILSKTKLKGQCILLHGNMWLDFFSSGINLLSFLLFCRLKSYFDGETLYTWTQRQVFTNHRILKAGVSWNFQRASHSFEYTEFPLKEIYMTGTQSKLQGWIGSKFFFYLIVSTGWHTSDIMLMLQNDYGWYCFQSWIWDYLSQYWPHEMGTHFTAF